MEIKIINEHGEPVLSCFAEIQRENSIRLTRNLTADVIEWNRATKKYPSLDNIFALFLKVLINESETNKISFDSHRHSSRRIASFVVS